MARARILLTIFLSACSYAVWAENPKTNKPNVIIILADDLGYHDVGFHGSESVGTPHLDNLAAGGVICTDGHVTASVCSPSRAGLMTGRYQQRFGHEANKPPRSNGMDVNERTLADALKALGYRTAVFGKWHLGEKPQFHPNKRGFDEFWGLRSGGRGYWYNERESRSPNARSIEHNGKNVAFESYLTDCLGDRAVEFIDRHHNDPFFVYLSFTAPHAPLHAKQEDRKAGGNPKPYPAMVYGMDRNIGKVLDALDKHDLRNQTLIWFLSDNGGVTRNASNRPLGGKKGTKFEGGHRVPFVINWPEHIKAGTKFTPMVSSLDIYATSVAAAGGSLQQPRPLDGVDLLPYLMGKRAGVPHQQLYWRKLECAAMREGKWKLIRVKDLGYALYDLESNISESNNLADEMPERVAAMAKLLEKWEKGMIEPLWREQNMWTKERYKWHRQRF